MPSSARIDLIKGKTSLVDQFLKWALSFGRLLIIIVEVVAFSAFMYRFVLDRQIIDLNDEIKTKQSIIESSKIQETTYRNLHERLATIRKINTTGNTTPQILKGIVDNTPTDITYDSVSIGDGKLSMQLSVTSFSTMTEFMKSLKENPQIESATITGIDNSSGGNSVVITISAALVGASEETSEDIIEETSE